MKGTRIRARFKGREPFCYLPTDKIIILKTDVRERDRKGGA
jgi:hypothetical protein